MANIILQCFYFILPAYFANMAPVLAKNMFRKMAFPIDFNIRMGKDTILGKNKTYRGLVAGVLAAIIVAYMQFFLNENNILAGLALLDYSNWLLIGLLLAAINLPRWRLGSLWLCSQSLLRLICLIGSLLG